MHSLSKSSQGSTYTTPPVFTHLPQCCFVWFISSLLLFSCGFYLYYRWFYVVCKHFFQKKLYNPKDINTKQAYHAIILNYIRRY